MIFIAKIFAFLFQFETQVYYIYKNSLGHALALNEHKGDFIYQDNGFTSYRYFGYKVVLTQSWESK